MSGDLLACRVDDVSAGRETVAGCVAGDPAFADDLHSLLEAVQSIAPPPDAEPDGAFRARGRAVYLVAMLRTNGHRIPNGMPRNRWRGRSDDD